MKSGQNSLNSSYIFGHWRFKNAGCLNSRPVFYIINGKINRIQKLSLLQFYNANIFIGYLSSCNLVSYLELNLIHTSSCWYGCSSANHHIVQWVMVLGTLPLGTENFFMVWNFIRLLPVMSIKLQS